MGWVEEWAVEWDREAAAAAEHAAGQGAQQCAPAGRAAVREVPASLCAGPGGSDYLDSSIKIM